MCKALFLLVALLAAPIEVVSKMEDAVVPEASTTMQSKDSTNHKDAMSFLKSTGSNSIDAAKLVVEKMKVNPGSLASLNQAIDTIIGEIASQSTADQQLVDGMVAAFVTASALPVRDTALDAAQTTTCAVVAPAQTALTASQTKSYQLDFGATAETARQAATGVKGNVDADLQAFEEALRNLGAKTLACSGATTAATAAAGDLATAKDRAYCQAKDSYDLAVSDVTTNSVTHTTNIKHFKMLKCVMTEYAADTKEKAAFDKCSAQTYDVDVASVTVDLRASQAIIPDSTVCVTAAPTAPPTEAPTGPPAGTGVYQLMSSTPETWGEAKARCESNSMILPVVTSQAKSDALQAACVAARPPRGYDCCWLGLFCSNGSGGLASNCQKKDYEWTTGQKVVDGYMTDKVEGFSVGQNVGIVEHAQGTGGKLEFQTYQASAKYYYTICEQTA